MFPRTHTHGLSHDQIDKCKNYTTKDAKKVPHEGRQEEKSFDNSGIGLPPTGRNICIPFTQTRVPAKNSWGTDFVGYE